MAEEVEEIMARAIEPLAFDERTAGDDPGLDGNATPEYRP